MARSSAVSSANRSVYIVGAGVAGCAAAFTALELGYRVQVLEAGPSGPLPAALRSPDLNRAGEAIDWWWSADYLAGRGIGGGSAINGMVVQTPAEPDDEVRWARRAFDPSPAVPGPLGRAVVGAAGDRAEVAQLSVRNGERQTAADLWLQPHDRLSVSVDSLVRPSRVSDWVEAGDTVLVAAGAMRSPGLVGAPALPAKDHQSVVIEFEVPFELQGLAADQAVCSVILRWGDCQGILLERAGIDGNRGAIVLSAMVQGAVLANAVDAALELLGSLGIIGLLSDVAAPVAHACCTLLGVDTIAPVIDASTLPELPSVNPMLSVAAHARRETLRILA